MKDLFFFLYLLFCSILCTYTPFVVNYKWCSCLKSWICLVGCAQKNMIEAVLGSKVFGLAVWVEFTWFSFSRIWWWRYFAPQPEGWEDPTIMKRGIIVQYVQETKQHCQIFCWIPTTTRHSYSPANSTRSEWKKCLSDDYIEIGVKERPVVSLARSVITLFLCVMRTLCWHWHMVARFSPSEPVSKSSGCCSGCWERWIFVLSKARGVHLRIVVEDASASCTHFLFLVAAFLLLSVVLKHPHLAHLGCCRFSMLVQRSRLCLCLCMPSPFSTVEYVMHSQSQVTET